MKLLTTIKPMSDGTVVLEAEGGKKRWVFKADEAGDLVAEVDDEDMVCRALATGNFQPANEADFEAADVLLTKSMGGDGSDGSETDPGGGGDDDMDDDPVDPNAPPLEANTPPKETKQRKARAPKSAD